MISKEALKKECPSCKNVLDTSFFGSDKNRKDKMSFYCRGCTNLRARRKTRKTSGGYDAGVTLGNMKKERAAFHRGIKIGMELSRELDTIDARCALSEDQFFCREYLKL